MASAHAQSKIDSLNQLIAKATSDTQKINLSVEKIRAYDDIDLDSAIIIGNETINNAKAIHYQKGEVNARINIAFSYCYKGDYIIAKENLDISKKMLLGINDSIALTKMYNNYGNLYAMQGWDDTALVFYKKALALAVKRKDNVAISTECTNIGISYQNISNFPQAISYYQQGLKASAQVNDLESEAYNYLNMANTFRDIGDNARAEAAFLNAINLARKLHLKLVECYSYSNLSALYGGEQKYKQEYDLGMKAVVLAKEIGDLGIEASSLSRMASALDKQNKLEDAEILAREAMNIADSSNQPLNKYQTYAQMGEILSEKNEYRQAIPYFEKAFHSLSSSDLYDPQVASSYQSLSECYEKTGNYNKALTAYKKSAQISDSLRSKDNVRKATELSLNYEFAKKQQVMKDEQEKKDAVATTRQMALIVGLILTLLLAAVAFNGYRHKQKANKLLQLQNERIEDTLSELKSTQAQLIQSEKMASLGQLTAGIAHEIQNPLNFVNNFSELNTELIAELEEEVEKGHMEEVTSIAKNIKENEQRINHHGKRADSIVKGMLQHSRISDGKKELTDVNALVDEYMKLSYHGISAKDRSFAAAITAAFDKRVGKVNINKQDIGRVLLNIFNNAFYTVNEKKKKAGEQYEPTITVDTARENKHIRICIKDNGSGIPQSIINKIFQPFFTTKPTGQGTGLGLSLSYDIIKAHEGTIKVESKEGEGSEFIIELPVNS